MSDEPITKAATADWLRRIANDIRSSGDVPLVHMDESGVGPEAISLADELWLVALHVDEIREVQP